jgi:putative transposase
MRKSRFTTEQIIRFIKQAEAGMAVSELARQHGFSPASFYAWRAKYGGMEVEDAKRLKALELENNRLKRLLAEAHLDIKPLLCVMRPTNVSTSATGFDLSSSFSDFFFGSSPFGCFDSVIDQVPFSNRAAQSDKLVTRSFRPKAQVLAVRHHVGQGPRQGEREQHGQRLQAGH